MLFCFLGDYNRTEAACGMGADTAGVVLQLKIYNSKSNIQSSKLHNSGSFSELVF